MENLKQHSKEQLIGMREPIFRNEPIEPKGPENKLLGPTFGNEDTPSVYDQIKDLEAQFKACEQELAQLLDELKRVPEDLELVRIIVKWRIDETQEQRFKLQLELNELFRIYGKYYFHNNNI